MSGDRSLIYRVPVVGDALPFLVLDTGTVKVHYDTSGALHFRGDIHGIYSVAALLDIPLELKRRYDRGNYIVEGPIGD